MENNQQNKEIFFAQYWKQDVAIMDNVKVRVYVLSQISYLQLKPISSITDEDAKKVCDLNYVAVEKLNNQQIKQIVILINSNNWNRYEIYEYLRSKGYALPWMGLSVKKLQEYGWIKLVN